MVEVTGRTCDVVSDALLHRAESDPDRTAFSYRQDSITFAELADRATARASKFQGDGVSAGNRVAIVMPAGLALVESFWALQLLGAATCVFNPDVPGPTLLRRIEMIRPARVVAQEAEGDA